MVRDAEELKLYAPLGCGIMTGAGAFTHIGKCQPDDVVATVSLGGVRLARVCAAKQLGVKNIIAADLVPLRIELAKELGATTGLHSAPDKLNEKELSAAIKELTPGGLGCTHILDTTHPHPSTPHCRRPCLNLRLCAARARLRRLVILPALHVVPGSTACGTAKLSMSQVRK